MSEETKVGFWGAMPVDVREVPATDINGKPCTLLLPGKHSANTGVDFVVWREGEMVNITFNADELEALQRVARAQLEIEAKRGGR